MDLFELEGLLIGELGESELLNEILLALPSDTERNILEYIAKNYDIAPPRTQKARDNNMNKITREGFNTIANEIIWLCTISDDDDDIIEGIEKLLKDEGIIDIIEE